MKPLILKKSVIGASHKVKENGVCQDRHLVEFLNDDMVIAAVADGHGSDKCKFSDRGAEFAVNTFADIIKEMYHSEEEPNVELFIQQLRQNDAAKFIQILHSRWKRKIQNSYNQLKKEYDELKDIKEVDPELYGTTLLGMVISPEFIFAIQLGDGDIVFADNDGVKHVIDPPKFLGTETFSLSNKEPWKYGLMYFQRMEYMEKAPCMFILSSDGFSNSYVNDEQYKVACKDYFELVKSYGADAVQSQLAEWLSETSSEGCGDDITFVAVGMIKEDDSNAENVEEITEEEKEPEKINDIPEEKFEESQEKTKREEEILKTEDTKQEGIDE